MSRRLLHPSPVHDVHEVNPKNKLEGEVDHAEQDDGLETQAAPTSPDGNIDASATPPARETEAALASKSSGSANATLTPAVFHICTGSFIVEAHALSPL